MEANSKVTVTVESPEFRFIEVEIETKDCPFDRTCGAEGRLLRRQTMDSPAEYEVCEKEPTCWYLTQKNGEWTLTGCCGEYSSDPDYDSSHDTDNRDAKEIEKALAVILPIAREVKAREEAEEAAA
jgi:hypothetical protein